MTDNIIFKMRVPVEVAGMTVKHTEPAVLFAIETGNKVPIEVAGITVKYEPQELLITLLSAEDLKRFNK